MTGKRRKPPPDSEPAGTVVQQAVGPLPTGYRPFLEELKARIRAAQVKAALSANRELVALYWHIGRSIVERQRSEGWGRAVVERLSADIRREFPGIAGFSTVNIRRMRAFYLAWADPILSQAARELESPVLAQPVRELGDAIPSQPATHSGVAGPAQPAGQGKASDLSQPARDLAPPTLPQLAAELPWFHNVTLVEQVKDPAQRLWYARQTVANGWSRAMLVHWIESDLYARQGGAVTNFSATLPAPQSDLAQQVIKDPYVFDFLTLGDDAREKELEQSLMEHVQKFLLELGAGFAFVGRQVRLDGGGEEFSVDLLFYHLKLRCFVVVDLKAGGFKPEHAGKMNFYLSAVDAEMRHPDDAPSIGLLLCKAKNRIVVEYALRGIEKPIGVADWQTQIVKSLPRELEGALPTVEEIEAELGQPAGEDDGDA